MNNAKFNPMHHWAYYLLHCRYKIILHLYVEAESLCSLSYAL